MDITLEECLKYELSSKAMSLFDINGFMRSNKKADLATYLIKNCLNIGDTSVLSHTNNKIVLDGGALLHRVGWTKHQSFSQIIDSHHSFLRNLVDSAYLSPTSSTGFSFADKNNYRQ